MPSDDSDVPEIHSFCLFNHRLFEVTPNCHFTHCEFVNCAFHGYGASFKDCVFRVHADGKTPRFMQHVAPSKQRVFEGPPHTVVNCHFHYPNGLS